MAEAKNTKRPRELTKSEMDNVGVDILHSDIRLRCQHCGTEWSTNVQEGGTLPHGYWRCPNGCNSDDTE